MDFPNHLFSRHRLSVFHNNFFKIGINSKVFPMPDNHDVIEVGERHDTGSLSR